MPTIEASYKDLCRLIGKNMTAAEFDDAILFTKGEIDGRDGDLIRIDIKDTNRPDLWSAEGVAREIRFRTRGGFPHYRTKPSDVTVIVGPALKTIRPHTACAVVSNLHLNEAALSQLIQLQEKISLSFGRNRRAVAVGVYDRDRITPPIRFTAMPRKDLRFVPLGMERVMSVDEIVAQHPKGKEYGHLLGAAVPVFIDAAGEVLSMPPVINAAHTGTVTARTKRVFIECSGFDMRFLTTALNVIVAALYERGGTIETVKVVHGTKALVTPDLGSKAYAIDPRTVRDVSGLALSDANIKKLIARSGYLVEGTGKVMKLGYPAYRQDIMHARDVIEDIIITYGMNRIGPVVPELATKGGHHPATSRLDAFANLCTGLGLQEILSYTLTNKSNLFSKMNVPDEPVVEIENPASSNWSVFRSWLLPGAMDFLSKNMHREFPQRIFEIGTCVVHNHTSETKTADMPKLCAALSAHTATYDEISGCLDALLRNLHVSYELRPTKHGSFIDGRCASVIVDGIGIGVIGEINPAVLAAWELKKPVAAFELALERLLELH